MTNVISEIFKVVQPRDVIFAILVIGLMVLNWHKDKLIKDLTATVDGLAGDIKVLSELLRTLVYGRGNQG